LHMHSRRPSPFTRSLQPAPTVTLAASVVATHRETVSSQCRDGSGDHVATMSPTGSHFLRTSWTRES
jgi:hypothetical protein